MRSAMEPSESGTDGVESEGMLDATWESVGSEDKEGVESEEIGGMDSAEGVGVGTGGKDEDHRCDWAPRYSDERVACEDRGESIRVDNCVAK